MSGDNSVNTEELAEAFEGKKKKTTQLKNKGIKKAEKVRKKLGMDKRAFAFFCAGMVILAVGLILLVVKIITGPKFDNAEFLVSAGEWVREDDPTVIWDFTDIGEGELTTDGHLNNYLFIWSIDGGKLKIETTWLYDLNDEFDYSLDQGAKILTIRNHDRDIEVKFKAEDKQ